MKNINIVNRTIATKLGLELSIVETVNKLYWREVKAVLGTLSSNYVHVKRLGTISISYRKLRGEIIHFINKIRQTKSTAKYTDETRERMLATQYGSLRLLLSKRNELAIDFYINHQRRQNERSKRLPYFTTQGI